ncbi:uncharacterized protein [Haliotis asinina]|uniref:uncharacterized protein n=1 Tax=Haliotis asinina TaxID=109174 RepID=UPI003531C865
MGVATAQVTASPPGRVKKDLRDWKYGPRKTELNANEAEKKDEADRRFGGFQWVSDNITFVYSGYYDDRDDIPVVRVIAMIPDDLKYYYTCILEYPNEVFSHVIGFAKYNFARVLPGLSRNRYRNGYVICPVAKTLGRPSFLSVHQQGNISPRNNITMWRSKQRKNSLTRCIKAFESNYNNVSQLVWNIELNRLFGVDKSVFYLNSQTQDVVNMPQNYEAEGIVEIRNFSINLPGSPIEMYIKSNKHWTQLGTYHECLLSQMKSAKYVTFHDVDEIIVPRKYKYLVHLEDDLLNKTSGNKITGSLLFKNVYFPVFKNKTTKDFPFKRLAEIYDIHPLLYTTRMKTNHEGISPKRLVIPDVVEEMFIHHVEVYKPGYLTLVVEEDVASMHHYRRAKTKYMYEPESEDVYMHRFSETLVAAVVKRCMRGNHAQKNISVNCAGGSFAETQSGN